MTDDIEGDAEAAEARLLQGIRLIDTWPTQTEGLRLLRSRLVGELVGDADRVAATLDPGFELVMHVAGTAMTMTSDMIVGGVHAAAADGKILWIELDDLVVGDDAIALHGRMGSFQRQDGTATTTPLGVFIRFAGGRMVSETLFLDPSAAAATDLGSDAPTTERLLELVPDP